MIKNINNFAKLDDISRSRFFIAKTYAHLSKDWIEQYKCKGWCI